MKENIIDEDYDYFYIEIAKVVEDDAKAVFYKRGFTPSYNISQEDIEDVLQEIQVSVAKGLVSFIKDSGEKSVGERNSWLATIVTNRINDFFRKIYKNNEIIIQSIDDKDIHADARDDTNPENDFINSVCNENVFAVCNALKRIFKIDTSPEKMLAYLFNRFICATSDTKKSSGSPKDVAKQLNGKTIEEAARFMKQKIRNYLEYDIPDEVFAELDKKLNTFVNGVKNADKIFFLSPKKITDSSNRIADKMKYDEDTIKEDRIEESFFNEEDNTIEEEKQK